MDDKEFVLDLQQKGYEIGDGHTSTAPELEDLNLRNVHRDADYSSLRHVRFGNFMDRHFYYFRVTNPDTNHRFYAVVGVEDPEATEIMSQIRTGEICR